MTTYVTRTERRDSRRHQGRVRVLLDHQMKSLQYTDADRPVLGPVSGERRRKVCRIVEKRVCQRLHRRARSAAGHDYSRSYERRCVADALRNVCGPSEYHAAA